MLGRRVVEVIDPIFKEFSPDDNLKFSSLSGVDLQDALDKINQYDLVYRNNLGFSSKSSYGIELEFEFLESQPYIEVLNAMKLNDWTVKKEITLSNGKEITSPVLNDKDSCWHDIYNVCEMLESNAFITDDCAAHVHVGAQLLGHKIEYWENFFNIWSTYENVLFRYLYGEYLNVRLNILKYAPPVANDFLKYIENIESGKVKLEHYDALKKYFGSDRFRAVSLAYAYASNVETLGNTIEFRPANGTLNAIIWQNNINALVKLVEYSVSRKFNQDIIEKRKRLNMEVMGKIGLYGEIYLDQVLEFVDLIFNKNIDKIYFLRQYLKNFETGNLYHGDLAKPFTRKK